MDENLNGIQEVRGSTPLGSTNKNKGLDQIDLAPFSLKVTLVVTEFRLRR
jgi:hypothetical protein